MGQGPGTGVPLPFGGTMTGPLPFSEAQSPSNMMGVHWLGWEPCGSGGSRPQAWGGDTGNSSMTPRDSPPPSRPTQLIYDAFSSKWTISELLSKI